MTIYSISEVQSALAAYSDLRKWYYQNMKNNLYQHTKYYNIAFDFVDITKQINLFEEYISTHSKIPVKSVLDIACGPALQLIEFAKREYKGFGLDLSDEMVNNLNHEAVTQNLNIQAVKSDMVDFSLTEKVDFAYILMGSIVYLRNNDDFVKHLEAVATCLKPGGLYLIENLAMTWTDPKLWEPQTWTMEKGSIKIDVRYKISLKDELTQTIEQAISLKVNDGGKIITLEDRDLLKLIMPQEFKTIVELQGDFEFVGFFERWSLNNLSKSSSDNLVAIRRK